MKNILTNGCSHIEGSETENSIGDFIAKELNLQHVNIAEGGGSNHRIFRTTLEYCEENDVDFVVIGWTTHERFEFSFDEKRQNYTLQKQSDDKDLEKFYRYADLHLADWHVGLENTIAYQFALQEYFNAKEITYLYCNMFNYIPKKCQIPLWKSIDTTKYYKPHESFIEKYMELYPEDFSDSKHIKNENLHSSIADELVEMYRWRDIS